LREGEKKKRGRKGGEGKEEKGRKKTHPRNKILVTAMVLK